MLVSDTVATYQSYKTAVGEGAIDRAKWDELVNVVGTKQMLPYNAIKNSINRIKRVIQEERRGH